MEGGAGVVDGVGVAVFEVGWWGVIKESFFK